MSKKEKERRKKLLLINISHDDQFSYYTRSEVSTQKFETEIYIYTHTHKSQANMWLTKTEHK